MLKNPFLLSVVTTIGQCSPDNSQISVLPGLSKWWEVHGKDPDYSAASPLPTAWVQPEW